jgi:putative glycosyltransferase (TIGR04372 family)
VKVSWISFFRFRFSLFRKRIVSFIGSEYEAVRQNHLLGHARITETKYGSSEIQNRGPLSYLAFFMAANQLLMQGEYDKALRLAEKAEFLRNQKKKSSFTSTFIDDWAGGDLISNIGHTALGLQLLRFRGIVEGIHTPTLFHSFGSTNKLLVKKMSEHVKVRMLPLLKYYQFEKMFGPHQIEMNFVKTKVGILEINEAFKYYAHFALPLAAPLSIEDNERDAAFGALRDTKLDLTRPLIAIHIREANEDDPLRSGNYSDLDSIVQACLPFAEQGFQFIRMGNRGMKSLSSVDCLKKSRLRNCFFDYANSDMKSELMDVFFWSYCIFLIGGDSGPITVPMLFNKPVLRLNANKPFLENIGHSGFVAPKLIRDQNTGGLLYYREAMDKTFISSHKFDIYPFLRECLPSSIIESCISDMLDNYFHANHIPSAPPPNKKQNQFPSLWKSPKHYPTHELPIAPSFIENYSELF